MNLAKYILLKANIKLINPRNKKRLLLIEKLELDDIRNVYNKIRICFPTLIEGKNLRPYFFRHKVLQVVLVGFEEISRCGFVILSVPIGKRRWFKSQSVGYFLFPENQHIPQGSQILHSCPEDVVIEKDLINARVRLRGQNCGPTGFGQWMSVKHE